MNRATKAVVFDIGNVLVGWDPRPAFAPDLDGPEAVEAFLRDPGYIFRAQLSGLSSRT